MAHAGIKAIETQYKGYRFRSRLEARWAVFFDALGIAWEYEPEGFELSDGTWYLPDFYLPAFNSYEGDHKGSFNSTIGTWCEVKPNGGDFSKASQFSADSGYSMWFCEGTPDFKIYTYIRPIAHSDYKYMIEWHVGHIKIMIEGYANRPSKMFKEDIDKTLSSYFNRIHKDQHVDFIENKKFVAYQLYGWPRNDIEMYAVVHWSLPSGDYYTQAVHAARSARFERNTS